MTQDPTLAEQPPPTIADYELLRLVGRGSYGDVWLARGVTGVFRAVKIVWRARFADAQPYEREFKGLKEFAAISLLESRQLALLHVSRNDAAGFFYYVMELADDAERGREIDSATYVPHTLREVRSRRGRLPAPEAVALGADLARALAGLHRRGLVHRDIKPSNIILVGGVPKLADIGLVAAASAAHTFVGTEGFVPPEGPGAPSADVFSLGKLLYELATGLDRHDYPRLPAELHALPDRKELLELNEVLIRACEPAPAKRHPDATALLDDLLLLQAGKSVRRLRAAERRLARALRVAAILTLITLIAGAGAFLAQQRAQREMDLRAVIERERDELARRSLYSGRMAQAFGAVQEGDFGRARKLLADEVPAPGSHDLRGLEWTLLSALARGDTSEILRPEGPVIDKLALSPSGDLLAVHDEGRTLTLYDAHSRQILRTISGVQRLGGFSSDGRWLVGTSAPPASSLQRWSVATGALDASHKGASFRPLAASGPGGILTLEESRVPGDAIARALALVRWDFDAGRATARQSIAPPPAEKPWLFFRAGADEAGGMAVIACVSGQGNDSRFCLSVSAVAAEPWVVHEVQADGFLPSAVGILGTGPKPRIWATERMTGRERVFDWSTRRWKDSPRLLPPGTTQQVAGPLGSTLIAHDALLSRTEAKAAPSPSRSLRGHATLISALAAGSRGDFFSAASDGELRRWDSAQFRAPLQSRQVWDSRATTTGIVFSPDGRQIFAPEDGQNVGIFDAANLQPVGRITGMRRPVEVSRAGLWGIAAEGRSLLWQDGQTLPAGETPSGPASIVQAAQTRDGTTICFTRTDGGLCFVDAVSRRLVRTHLAPKLHETLWSLQLDDLATSLWALSSGMLRRFNVADGRVVWAEKLEVMAASVCLDPASRRLYVCLQNGLIEVRDADSGAVRDRFRSGGASTEAMACTPEPFRLITIAGDGTTRIMDPQFQACYATLPAPAGSGQPHAVALSSRGDALAIIGKQGLLRIVSLR